MSQNTQLQERYSSLVEAKLRATSVFAGLFNRNYEGSPKAGAVKVPVRAEVQTGTYDITNGKALTVPTTSYATIVCDKDLAVNELIDGYVAAAVPDGLVADRLDSAGFALADTVDVALEAALVTGGTATSDSATALTKSNIYESIVDAVQAAKALKVNPGEMWLAVSNATYGKLIKSPEFIQATGSVAELGNGYVGSIAGIPVYESPNVTSASYILGNRAFCHYVSEWAVPVGVKDLADGVHIGASAVQGRQVYGYLVSKPTTVLYHA